MRLYVLLLLVLVCTVALVSSSSETEEERVERKERDEGISREGERGLGRFFKKFARKMKHKIKKLIHKASKGGSKHRVTDQAKEIKAEMNVLPEEDREQVEGYAVHQAEEAVSNERYRRVESPEDRIRRRGIFSAISGVLGNIFG